VLSEQRRRLLNIPAGIWHADRNLGQKDAVMINFPTWPYEHASPDKYRLPLDTASSPPVRGPTRRMTSLAATVLIPTHDHSDLLLYAARSALRQTVADLELLIVGDGVPDETREAVAELVEEDARVRFFDLPKGECNGEAYRDPILREARGSVVCYLSDDDLWLPSHVETMLGALEDADFATATTLWYDGEGELTVLLNDFEMPFYRDLSFSGVNRVPLSAGAHTVAMYRRLPHGWRTTPAGIPTDLYMRQQFLAEDLCRTAAAMTPTVLNFPSSARRDWTAARRVAELKGWTERIAAPDWQSRASAELLEMVVEAESSEWARQHGRLLEQHRIAIERGRQVEEMQEHVDRVQRSGDERREEGARVHAALGRERAERRRVNAELRGTRAQLRATRAEQTRARSPAARSLPANGAPARSRPPPRPPGHAGAPASCSPVALTLCRVRSVPCEAADLLRRPTRRLP
jgi:hypothetical protein